MVSKIRHTFIAFYILATSKISSQDTGPFVQIGNQHGCCSGVTLAHYNLLTYNVQAHINCYDHSFIVNTYEDFLIQNHLSTATFCIETFKQMGGVVGDPGTCTELWIKAGTQFQPFNCPQGVGLSQKFIERNCDFNLIQQKDILLESNIGDEQQIVSVHDAFGQSNCQATCSIKNHGCSEAITIAGVEINSTDQSLRVSSDALLNQQICYQCTFVDGTTNHAQNSIVSINVGCKIPLQNLTLDKNFNETLNLTLKDNNQEFQGLTFDFGLDLSTIFNQSDCTFGKVVLSDQKDDVFQILPQIFKEADLTYNQVNTYSENINKNAVGGSEQYLLVDPFTADSSIECFTICDGQPGCKSALFCTAQQNADCFIYSKDATFYETSEGSCTLYSVQSQYKYSSSALNLIQGNHQFYVGIQTRQTAATDVETTWIEDPVQVNIFCDITPSSFENSQAKSFTFNGNKYQAFYIPEFNQGNIRCPIVQYKAIRDDPPFEELDQAREGDFIVFYNESMPYSGLDYLPFSIVASTGFDQEPQGKQFGQFAMIQTQCEPLFANIKASNILTEQIAIQRSVSAYYEFQRFFYDDERYSECNSRIEYLLSSASTEVINPEGFNQNSLELFDDKVRVHPTDKNLVRTYEFFIIALGPDKSNHTEGPLKLSIEKKPVITMSDNLSSLINQPPFFDHENFVINEFQGSIQILIPEIKDANSNFDSMHVIATLERRIIAEIIVDADVDEEEDDLFSFTKLPNGTGQVELSTQSVEFQNDTEINIVFEIFDELLASSKYSLEVKLKPKQKSEPEQLVPEKKIDEPILNETETTEQAYRFENMKPTKATVGNWTDFVPNEKLSELLDDFVKDLDVSPDQEADPLKLVIKSFNNNGTSRLEFSEPTILPSFLIGDEHFQTERRLENTIQDLNHVPLSRINAEDLFEIRIMKELPSQDESDEINLGDKLSQFYLSITEWNEEFIELHTNFSSPLEVSNRNFRDRIDIKVLKPNIFVSKKTLRPLNQKYLGLNKDIPPQFPKNVDGEALKQNTNRIMIFSSVLLFINILIQIMFESNKGQSTAIILQMQNTVILTLFEINIPAQLQVVINQTRSLVNLQNIKPSGILSILSNNQKFEAIHQQSLVKMESNLQASGITSLQAKDNLSGFLFIPICMLGLMVIAYGVAFLLEKWFDVETNIKERLRKLKKDMLWNQVIRPFNLSYYTNCILFYTLVDLWGTEQSRQASIVSYILASIIFIQPLACWLILRRFNYRDLLFLENSKFQDALYPGFKHSFFKQNNTADIKKNFRKIKQLAVIGQIPQVAKTSWSLDIMKLRKYFQILVYFRRFMIIMTPLMFKGMTASQLVFLQVFQLTFIVVYIKIDPHWRLEKRIHLTNEFFSLLSFISLICQSDAVDDQETKFNFAYMTCSIIGSQLTFNLFIMAMGMVDSFIHRRNIQRRSALIDQIKEPGSKSIEGKVRSIHFRFKNIVYRADPNRFMLTQPCVSAHKSWLIKFMRQHPRTWVFLKRTKKLIFKILRIKRQIFMPLQIIDENPEFGLREDELDEIDEIWRKHFEVDFRKDRHTKKMFPKNRNKLFKRDNSLPIPRFQSQTVKVKSKKKQADAVKKTKKVPKIPVQNTWRGNQASKVNSSPDKFTSTHNKVTAKMRQEVSRVTEKGKMAKKRPVAKNLSVVPEAAELKMLKETKRKSLDSHVIGNNLGRKSKKSPSPQKSKVMKKETQNQLKLADVKVGRRKSSPVIIKRLSALQQPEQLKASPKRRKSSKL